MHKNILIYYCTEFLGALTFGLPVSTFFFTLHLGFSMGWAIFISTLTGLMSFLFEIPTGSWADRFGRKRMYVAGLVIGIFGLSFYLWATTIPLFILASVIIGLSSAIMSGNIEAILHDNLSEHGDGGGYKEVQANGYTFFFSGRVIACLFWWIFYTIHPVLPFALTFGVMCLILPAFLLIDEPRQELSHAENDRKHIYAAWKSITNRSDLVYVLLGLFLLSWLGNVYWFSYQPYLQSIGFSIVSIGVAYALASGFSAIGANALKRLLTKGYDELRILQHLWILFLLASIGFGFFSVNPSPLWLLPIALLSIAFGTFMSLGNCYILKDIPPTYKSAALSIFSFGITLGYFLFSWFIGFFIDRFSIQNTYLAISVLVIILFLGNLVISRRFIKANS